MANACRTLLQNMAKALSAEKQSLNVPKAQPPMASVKIGNNTRILPLLFKNAKKPKKILATDVNRLVTA